MNQRKAFTLIELLIVVAIIAILAAIAVPNFLEAQTRSKVSRAKADMRTIATAMESYQVDNNGYTAGSGGLNPGENFPQNAKKGYVRLVKPIPYITSIPSDAFGWYTSAGGDRHPAYYELGTGKVGVGNSGDSFNGSPLGVPADAFLIQSTGPDNIDDTQNPLSPVNFPSGIKSFPVRAWRGDPDAPPAIGNGTGGPTPADIIRLIYDPTNGTISPGEISRVGGVPGDTETLQMFTGAIQQ
jgi:type II secretion system protein G